MLGLLAMTVKGSNTLGAGIDSEQLAIRVAEVQQYGQELERAVTYVLRNGHSEIDIRFASPKPTVRMEISPTALRVRSSPVKAAVFTFQII